MGLNIYAFHYISQDGQVEVITKTATARPMTSPSCAAIQTAGGHLRPKHGDGVEVVMTHLEVTWHLAALNRADAKGKYRWNNVAAKCATAQGALDKLNQKRNSKKGNQTIGK